MKPTPGPRMCNRHMDCDAADERAKALFNENLRKPFRERKDYPASMQWGAEHCNDDDCEDCHGR